MTFRLGVSSETRLLGVDPRLCRVVRRAIELSRVDFSVICGIRSHEEQARLVAIGASRTMHSAHLSGMAVDLQPYLGSGVNPYPLKGDGPAEITQKLRRFEDIAAAMFSAADELSVPLQWGNDWDLDGTPVSRDKDERGSLVDMPHFQIPGAHRTLQATARADERRAARARGEAVVS